MGLVLPVVSSFPMRLQPIYEEFEKIAAWLQCPLLLALRLYWGGSFFLTGKGKLLNLDRTAEYFGSLNIPLPKLNAALAGGTECLGGLLLVIGLFSRAAAVPLVFTLGVAYATAERDSLQAIFRDPDKFTAATPFLFLFAVLVVLAFGPGKISVDYLWRRRFTGSGAGADQSADAGNAPDQRTR
jgi:putative oxidoreductase